ncbi:hypothetical protein J6590_068474 [Homalodisca vitripennis]|nr:hypothetical protein J6590_068474 [Homalodisca vitripennis]
MAQHGQSIDLESGHCEICGGAPSRMLSVIQRMLQCFMWIFTGQILLLYRRIYAAAEQVTSAMLVRVWEEIDNIWDICRINNRSHNGHLYFKKGRTAVHWITCEQGRTAVQGVLVNCSEGEKPQSTGVLVSGSGGKNHSTLEYLWEEPQRTGVLVSGSGGKNRRELEYLLAAQVGRIAEHWSTCYRLRWEEPQRTGVLVSGSGGKNRRPLEYL